MQLSQWGGWDMARKVLVVGNHDASLMILHDSDYTVLDTASGEQALEILRQGNADISAVLLDINMPDMDGYQVLEAMRADPALSQIPVIVITGSTGFDAEKKALALGASDYVMKPLDRDIIRHRIESAITARETREQMQAVVENIDSGVTAFALRGDGQVDALLITDRYYEMLGYTKEQFWAELETPFEPISKEDIGWVYERIQKTRRPGQAMTLEFRATRRDGREIWLRATVTITQFAGVDAPVQLGVFTDITDSVKADRQSKSTSAQLKLLTDNIPGGIATYGISPEGAWIIYFNDGFCRMLGYTREEYEAMTADSAIIIAYEEDIPGLRRQMEKLHLYGTPIDYTYRVHRREGGLRWITLRGSVMERQGDVCYYNAMILDVTAQQEMFVRLRESEERFRIASDMAGALIGRYDIRTGAYIHNDKTLHALGFASVIENVPQAYVDAGTVAAGSVQALFDFYTRVREGESPCSTDARLLLADGEFHWCRVDASVMPDDDGRPTQAIIVTTDISEQREKEAVYKKWQQSLAEKPQEDYTLYRWNLSQDSFCNAVEGSLLDIEIDLSAGRTFNDNTFEYAERYVHPDDCEAYMALLNSDAMLANYRRGVRTKTLEYRELLGEGALRWLHLTIEMVEYPNSTEVEAYLMYEDIDASKRKALRIHDLATTDSMTGLSNRGVTEELATERLAQAGDDPCALLIVDLDDLKMINDTLGHAEGDRALIELSRLLRAQFRHTDVVGRVGGDEFIVFLSGVTEELLNSIIPEFMLKVSGLYVGEDDDYAVSCSIGIAMGGRDDTYGKLFRQADKALYHNKRTIKGEFAFYTPDMEKTGQIPCC